MKMKNNNKLTRRELILLAMSTYGGIGLRSLLTGLPVHFLTNQSLAFANQARFLIYSGTSAGDPVNCNVPGTYVPDYAHPEAYKNPVNISLGGKIYQAATVWNDLSPELKNCSNFFHIRTGTNSHLEMNQVLTVAGDVQPIVGRAAEMLPSVVAHEQFPLQNTSLREPVCISGRLKFENRTLLSMRPRSLKDMFDNLHNDKALANIRDQQLDKIYRDLRRNGTPAQMKFLDQHARSKNSSLKLATNLATALSDIDDDSSSSQVKCAAALLALNFTTVIKIGIGFGGDNHHDTNLSGEVNAHSEGVSALNALYAALKSYGIENKTNFAMINIFGRTPHRNSRGGRDHHGDHSIMYSFGPDIRPGVIGGIKKEGRFNWYKSQGINSVNGSITNPDILPSETMHSAAKSILAASGVSDPNKWINGGKAVEAFLK